MLFKNLVLIKFYIEIQYIKHDTNILHKQIFYVYTIKKKKKYQTLKKIEC